MTHQEAKEILSSYREDLPRDAAPRLDAALALLEADVSLSRWWEQERQFDADFASALARIPVPDHLAEQIVASVETGMGAERETPIRAFPRRRLWWAAAALLLLTTGGLVKFFLFPPPVVFPPGNFASVEKFCDDMAHYANSRFVLGKFTGDYAKARDWLRQRESPIYEDPPPLLVDYEGMGCQTFLWGEEKVSLVCFKNLQDEIVHLFVVDRDVFEKLVPPEQLRAVQVLHKLETGGWMAEDKLFLLVGSEPEVEIGNLLSQVGKS